MVQQLEQLQSSAKHLPINWATHLSRGLNRMIVVMSTPIFEFANFFNNYWAPGNNWIPAIILLVRPIQSSASFLKHSRQWCCCPSPATNKWVVAPSKQNLFNTWKASATWNHIQPKGKFQRTNPHHRMWVPSSISPTTKRKKKITLLRVIPTMTCWVEVVRWGLSLRIWWEEWRIWEHWFQVSLAEWY